MIWKDLPSTFARFPEQTMTLNQTQAWTVSNTGLLVQISLIKKITEKLNVYMIHNIVAENRQISVVERSRFDS